jgi:hypothetical protein
MNASSTWQSRGSIVRLSALALAFAACGGGGGKSGGATVIIPEVPAGAFEDGCQQLCTLASNETVCTAKHAYFCLQNCRARTRDLPSACGDCLITAGTPISGYIDNFSNTPYCNVGGPADLVTCASACDDAGAAAPSPDLDLLCQLECSFYVKEKTPLACSMAAASDCLTPCRDTISAQPRICAQCMIERTGQSQICVNTDCDCVNDFPTSAGTCDTLCDTLPPM